MIYLIRHGETDWNKSKTIQGCNNKVALNKKGRKQVYKVAKYFSTKHLSCIITSPLTRAYQTANIIAAKRSIPVITDIHFKEIDYGDWSGKTGKEVKTLYSKEYNNFINDPENFRFKNGESIKEFYSRVVEGLESLNKKDDILIVTHVNPIRMVISYILGIPIRKAYKIHVENCAVSGIKYNNSWEVSFLNCRII